MITVVAVVRPDLATGGITIGKGYAAVAAQTTCDRARRALAETGVGQVYDRVRFAHATEGGA
jgi:hypothetical protein